MKESIKKYGYYIILTCILAFGFYLRLKGLIINPSFSHDECALGWNVIYKNYSDFFGVLRFLQIAPPFFMITVKLTAQMFGISDFTLRLVPFFFGISSLFLFFKIANKIFKNKVSIAIATFLFSINQNLVNYSSEFKHYSCDVFFTLICIYIFCELFQEEYSLKKVLIFSLIFAISIWFSFVSIFAISAGFLVLSLKQIKEGKYIPRKFFILILPLILSFLLYAKVYLISTYNINEIGMTKYWQDGFIVKNLSNLIPLLLANIKYILFPTYSPLFLILLFFCGHYLLIKKNFYIGLFFTLTLFLICFASWLGLYPFAQRLILFLTPIFLIFVCAPLELITKENKIKSFFILGIFSITFLISLLYCYEYTKMKNIDRGEHPREMMLEMVKHIKPNDIIIVNQNSNTEFAYYSSFYNIKNKIVQQPQHTDVKFLIKLIDPKESYWFYMPYKPDPKFMIWLQTGKLP